MSVALLMSGGVDSSVAALQLLHQKSSVHAFYLKIWLEDELSFLGNCPWEEDLSFVQSVCAQYSIPLEVVPLQKEYHQKVVAYLVGQVKQGNTPNPDVMCNQLIKFGAFYDHIGNSFEYIASGHYAQKKLIKGQWALCSAKDSVKDQTYFLARLHQWQLDKAIFPIGDLTKSEVRQMAHLHQLAPTSRPDSQGLCFLGKISFKQFLLHHCGKKAGFLIEHETGKKMGTHDGYWFYTVGQRKDIGLSGGPWYVVSKDIENNTIFISRFYFSQELDRSRLYVSQLLWYFSIDPTIPLKIKVRHGPHFYTALSYELLKNDTLLVAHLDSQDQGIAAGQFAVFYQGEVCIGSGVITHLLE